MSQKQRVESVFVVRLWQEPSTAPAGWRGSLEDLVAKKRMYFSNLFDLPALIRERLEGALVAVDGDERAE